MAKKEVCLGDESGKMVMREGREKDEDECNDVEEKVENG